MLLRDVRDHAHLFRLEDDARGVAGVGEHDGAGLLVDERLNPLAVSEIVAFLGRGGQRADGRARCAHEGVVVGVEGLRNDDLIAIIQNAVERDGKRFAAAGGDDHVVGLQMNVQIGVIFFDSLDHFRDTGGGSVLKHGLLKVFDSIKISLRRFNVGLADVEMVNLRAPLFGFYLIGIEFADGRKIAFLHFAGELHGKPPDVINWVAPKG